ncbi:acetylcholine receptor subunit alpha-like [Haliotis rufescens]|uniref:acetylcholine receptor subunit alpha-like n=1 Tax=Haliotis rufescens TaxID=6454 RepID=UPI00201FAC15|nr:acetylcholine receptor subunit alpha-like [Haliotis rufescens]
MADTQESQKQLNSYLETRFNPDVPPIDPHTNAIDVQIAIGPVQVQDLVDATQVLKCRVFVVMSWKDTSLAWNASDYPNVVQTEIAPHKAWSPNVMLLNAAFGDGPLSTTMPITLVMDGSLYWQNIIMVYTISSSGEKMGYLMAVFVSNALFLSLIHDTMPSTSDSVSNLSIYQVAIHMQGFLAIAATILVQNIYHRQQKTMEEGAHLIVSSPGLEAVLIEQHDPFQGLQV